MMDKEEEISAARTLYMQGFTQKRIAAIFNRSENTIGRWAEAGNWAEELADSHTFKHTSLSDVRTLITHNLKILTKIAELNSEFVDTKQTAKELQSLLIERGDVDALQKLFTTIRGKEIEWDQLVKTITEFTEFIESKNIELAKELTVYSNEFINNKR